MRTNRSALFVVAGIVCLSINSSPGQEQSKDRRSAGPQSKQTSEKSGAKATPKAAAVVTAIVGADVHTVTRGVLRNGTIVITDGKITAVGQDVPVPPGAKVIQAQGKVVTPGFVAVNASGLGIRPAGAGGPGGGGEGPGARPARLTDSLNPFDRNMLFSLGAGITTACVDLAAAGGRGFGRSADDETTVCACCGLPILPTEPITPAPPTERTPRRHAVLKLSYGDAAPMLVKETPFYHVTAASLAGALNRHRWREQVTKAKQYVKDQQSGTEATERPGLPSRRPVSDDLIKLAKKEVPLFVDAASAEQIREMIGLARELDYNIVIDDAHEAWLTAAELGAGKATVVLTPRSRRRPQPGKEESSGSSIETSGTLEKAGVPFAVATLGSSVSLDGIAGRDLTSLALEAAFAVRGGCSEATALAALTIEPARILGLGDRIGSIEVGKDADLLILSGQPLDYRTVVERALVLGRDHYDRSRDRIYPDLDRLPR